MQLICLSDTHGYQLRVPDGDVLIHAGDATMGGSEDALREFADWFLSLPHPHKIFVPGNHDFWMQTEGAAAIFSGWGVHVLIGQEVEIEGLKFWGGPWVPNLPRWAFPETAGCWNIPKHIDVLITHGPIYGVSDVCNGADGWPVHVGSADLARAIPPSVQVHVHGHIHECHGVRRHVSGRLDVNCAIMDERYHPANWPIEVNI